MASEIKLDTERLVRLAKFNDEIRGLMREMGLCDKHGTEMGKCPVCHRDWCQECEPTDVRGDRTGCYRCAEARERLRPKREVCDKCGK